VSELANGSRRLRRRASRRPSLPGGDRRDAGPTAVASAAVQRAERPDGAGPGPDERLELGVYIGEELDRGRALFDVLGDPCVWSRVQDDPFLLSRVANDERVLAALARTSSWSLPQSDGGVAR
jgi:hypothetical protein